MTDVPREASLNARRAADFKLLGDPVARQHVRVGPRVSLPNWTPEKAVPLVEVTCHSHHAQQPMPLREYLALPPEQRAEYVDGAALMTPPASFGHQRICQRITDLLGRAVAAQGEVVAAAGWQLGPAHFRIPDVMVLVEAPRSLLVTDAPLVCVEVVSRNSPGDLVRKSTEYLQAGVDQYWIVDARDRTIDVYSNAGGRWCPMAGLDEENPLGTVDLPLGGKVSLNLLELLA